jgi:hypothetical protein
MRKCKAKNKCHYKPLSSLIRSLFFFELVQSEETEQYENCLKERHLLIVLATHGGGGG